MSNWLIKATFDWLELIYDVLKEILCMRKVLHADGYNGYHDLSDNIKVAGCFAHARRKFDEAVKGLSKKEQSDSMVRIGKRFCDKLFSLERDFSELTAEERFEKRQKLSKPVFDEFYKWLYTLNHRRKQDFAPRLFTHGGNTNIWSVILRTADWKSAIIASNGLGRKNWLFANTPWGAKASAILYSIIETARENGLDPYEYLTYVFKNAPNWNIQNNLDYLDLLMPWKVPGCSKARK